jgi:hypothetical protein
VANKTKTEFEKRRTNYFSKHTISPRSSFSNEKSDKTDAVPRINGTNTS